MKEGIGKWADIAQEIVGNDLEVSCSGNVIHLQERTFTEVGSRLARWKVDEKVMNLFKNVKGRQDAKEASEELNYDDLGFLESGRLTISYNEDSTIDLEYSHRGYYPKSWD